MVGASGNDDTEWQRDVSDRSLVLELLTDEHRRHAVSCLASYEESIPVSELAADVAARKIDRPRTEIPPREIQQIAIGLHHNHVPKLADAGVVEYDRERGLVELAEGEAIVDGALSLATAETDS